MIYRLDPRLCRSAYARNGKRGYELKLKEQTFSRLLCSALELVAFVEKVIPTFERTGARRRPSPRSQASWHTYDQDVALSRRTTASAATMKAAAMQDTLMRSGWRDVASGWDDSVQRSVVLLVLQQVPEEAHQDPSWPLSSNVSAAVRTQRGER